jgi:hypothetical protein
MLMDSPTRLAITLAAILAIAGIAAGQQKAMLALPDQFERPQDIAQFRGGVLVVLYGDKDGMPANKGLGEKLHVQYHPTARGKSGAEWHRAPVTPLPGLKEGEHSPEVKVLPVVCFGRMPEAVRGIIRNRVRKDSPDSPVLLDFEGRMKEQFGLKEGVPNLAVIDAAGRVCFRAAGGLDADGYAKLVKLIDALRKEAAEGK